MESLLSWAAPALTIAAALMTAANLGSRVTGWGFVVFTIGSLTWLALGVVTGQANIVWQNIALTALNLFGIWRWLGRQRRLERGAGEAQEQSVHTPGESLFPASLLTRAAIVGADGGQASAVDAMIGCRSGRLRYVVVAQGGLGGVGEEYRRLDWDALQPVAKDEADEGGEAGFCLAPGVRLADRPRIEPGQWPAR